MAGARPGMGWRAEPGPGAAGGARKHKGGWVGNPPQAIKGDWEPTGKQRVGTHRKISSGNRS
ncbi:hypothetical protein Aph01nite_54260 [Acrocarpospora phusangensis]|uniref:Uncharacterized protein n=1 Tax=Acrocarpospora phusangensis TaxID=1070424 RepID=A0A919QDZ8_9ACTN|nr:hypothetical protein Aph01nite_54260 [Acrocarpospora phusangensis]